MKLDGLIEVKKDVPMKLNGIIKFRQSAVPLFKSRMNANGKIVERRRSMRMTQGTEL